MILSTAEVKSRRIRQKYKQIQIKMATNIFDIQISNEKAFSLYKDVYGPARRQNSKGASEEDFQIACEILELCGVKLVQIEENVNVSTSNFKDSRVVLESLFLL